MTVVAAKLESLVDGALRDGSVKELLRRQYRRRFNPYYALEPLVARAEPQPDGCLLVELRDGTRVKGPRDEVVYRTFRYADPARIPTLAPLGPWSFFLIVLAEEFGEDVYGLDAAVGLGDVVVDVGAHIGGFTLRAARRVGPNGRVVAIEAAPENHALLCENLALNGLGNVTAVQRGVWNRAGELALARAGQSGAHSLADPAGATSDPSATTVRVDTLDAILAEQAIGRVDFVKMDIEGAELQALEGMDRTLATDGLRLAVAAYHRVDGQPTWRRVVPFLRRLGFDARVRGGIVRARRR